MPDAAPARRRASTGARDAVGRPDDVPAGRASTGARDVVGRPGVVLACGLATLDVVQTVDHVPAPDEKLVAGELLVSAGGPAANGAATAALLGVPARLVTRIGGGSLGSVVTADLRACGVDLTDLAPPAASPPVSTVLVTRSTGERAVVSVNATGFETPSVTWGPGPSPDVWDGAVVLLLDGHHLDLAEACAREARARGVLVLLDGGSWKPGLERVLPFVDVAVLSADFTMPGAGVGDDLLRAVQAAGPTVVAQSHGPRPVRLLTDDGAGNGPDDVGVPGVAVVDTLGAGDVLHGGLAAWLAVRGSGARPDAPPGRRGHRGREPLGGQRLSLADAAAGLTWAAALASASCEARGSRGWADDAGRLARWRAALGSI